MNGRVEPFYFGSGEQRRAPFPLPPPNNDRGEAAKAVMKASVSNAAATHFIQSVIAKVDERRDVYFYSFSLFKSWQKKQGIL